MRPSHPSAEVVGPARPGDDSSRPTDALISSRKARSLVTQRGPGFLGSRWRQQRTGVGRCRFPSRPALHAHPDRAGFHPTVVQEQPGVAGPHPAARHPAHHDRSGNPLVHMPEQQVGGEREGVADEQVGPGPASSKRYSPNTPVGCIYSVHASEQGIRNWLRAWTPPIPAKQSGTSGPHSWKLASEVDRRELRLRPREPSNGAGRGGDSSPLFRGSRPALDPPPDLGDTWSAAGFG